MRIAVGAAGYTLVEIIVALLVFTVGALALAASSALVAQAMATNALRERAGRIAASRIEVMKSQCAIAGSGQETVQQIESRWFVVSSEPSRIGVIESVRYPSWRGSRIVIYRATLWCPR